MKWTREEPTPPPTSDKWIMDHGKIRLAVLPHSKDSSQQFGYLSMTLGVYATATSEERRRTWPREALEKARDELDALEAALDEDYARAQGATQILKTGEGID